MHCYSEWRPSFISLKVKQLRIEVWNAPLNNEHVCHVWALIYNLNHLKQIFLKTQQPILQYWNIENWHHAFASKCKTQQLLVCWLYMRYRIIRINCSGCSLYTYIHVQIILLCDMGRTYKYFRSGRYMHIATYIISISKFY